MLSDLLETARRVALPALIALAMTVVLIAALRPYAARLGLVDRPGGRKQHAEPTPVIGGIAIGLAIAMAITWLLVLSGGGVFPTGLALGAAVLLITGIADDLLDLRWYIRFLAQAIAALCLIYIDGTQVEFIGPVFGLSPLSLGGFSPLFTIIATIGVINALNMADGVDGLAGTIVACALCMLGAASVYSGNVPLAATLGIILASLLGFLFFNMRSPWRPRAAVFLGNSGSEFLGLILAWASFRLTQNELHPVSPILAPFLIAPPVVDCLALMVRRALKGKSPFTADRTHMHHLLLDAGFSVTSTVLLLGLISIIIGAVGAVMLVSNLPHFVLLLTFLALTLLYVLFTLDWSRAVRQVTAVRQIFVTPRALKAAASRPSEDL